MSFTWAGPEWLVAILWVIIALWGACLVAAAGALFVGLYRWIVQ